jgi:hypothetical protein
MNQERQTFVHSVINSAMIIREMRNHEAAHTLAIDTTADQFIDDRRPDFETAMKALKQTPAPDAGR